MTDMLEDGTRIKYIEVFRRIDVESGVPVEERDLTVDQEPRNRTLMTEPLVHVGLTV